MTLDRSHDLCGPDKWLKLAPVKSAVHYYSKIGTVFGLIQTAMQSRRQNLNPKWDCICFDSVKNGSELIDFQQVALKGLKSNGKLPSAIGEFRRNLAASNRHKRKCSEIALLLSV